MKTVEIEVCERQMDRWWDYSDGKATERPKYHVQLKGKPGYWSAGKSIDEAIGGLIRSYPEKFGIKITNIGKQPR